MKNLSQFLNEWIQNYQSAHNQIKLFRPAEFPLNLNQQRFFARTFYHARGHFNDFLWLVANETTNKRKEVILSNMKEELGTITPSHEQLYFRFANALSVDVSKEFVEQKYYLPTINEFNK